MKRIHFYIALFILLIFTQSKVFAQPSFRSTSSSSTIPTGTSTVIVSKPTGTILGDIMILNLVINSSSNISNTFTPTSAGWTLYSGKTITTTTYGAVMYKVVKPSDAIITNYTFQLASTTTGVAASILTFSGVDTTNPFDATTPTFATGNTKFATANTITTTTPNAAIIMFAQSAGVTPNPTWNNTFWKTATSPGTLTEISDVQGTSTSIGTAWASKPTVGATGSGTDSLTGTATRYNWGSIMMALKYCGPRITTQPPATLNYCAGATLSINAVGAGNGISYQWKKNGIDISGATAATYTKSNIVLADSGTYTVAVINNCGSVISSNCVVKFIQTPTVTINTDYCVITGKIKLQAAPSIAGTYTYLWSNGTTKDTTSTNIAGSNTVTINNASSGCTATATRFVSIEYVINGNFNLGNTGFVTPTQNNQTYKYVKDSLNYQQELVPNGTYGIGTNANNYNNAYHGHDHTTGSGNFLIAHSFLFNQPSVWQQTISVLPNTTYYFSAWAMGLDSLAFGSYASMKFSVNGTQVGSNLVLTNHGSSDTAADNWQRFYATWNSGTATSAVFAIANTQISFGGNSLGLDDISIGIMGPFINLTSNPVTDSQVVCINTPITNISFSIGTGTAPTVTGLPTGVTATYNAPNLIISGTPSVGGTFNFIVSTAGCSVKRYYGQIIAQSQNIILSTAANTASQSICIGSAITNIGYTAVGTVTSAVANNLPPGVTASFNAGVLQISGTPTQSGIYNYTVTTLGGTCSNAQVSGTITINEKPVVNITSDYCIIPGKVLLKAIPSPVAAYTYVWSTGRTTDTSSVTVSNTYTVTVRNSTTTCSTIASITVSLGITLTSPAATRNPNVCLGNSLTNITFSTGPNITSVTVTGIPVGVSYTFASGIIAITGTPTAIGSYPYTITPQTSCGTVANYTGTIKVSANPTTTLTADYCAAAGKVRLKAIPSPTATYTYTWSNGALSRDTASVNAAGTYTVKVTNTVGCSGTASIPVSIELAVNGNFDNGNVGFTSPYNNLNQHYQYVADLPGVQNELNTAGLFGIGTNANNYNSAYRGHDHTNGSGNFMIVHGFQLVQPIVWQETVNVIPNTTYYFSAWGMGLDSLNNNATLRFAINGTQVGTDLQLVNHGLDSAAIDNWSRFYGTWNSGTATSATFTITDVRAISQGNGFGLDDISFGTIAPFISLISDQVTDTQIVCNNSPIVPISFMIGSNATAPSVSGLPPGVTTSYNGYKLTISGSPTSLGTFNYTVTTAGCSIQTYSGQIISQGPTIVLTSPASTTNQTVCNNNPINNITYIAGNSITSSNATVTGLPNGVTYSVTSGVLTIGGTPTVSGTFNYIVTLTGGICSAATTTITTTGTITVQAAPVVTISTDYCIYPGKVKLQANVTPTGVYTYLWSNGITTDTVTVDLVGAYTVKVTNTNGCFTSQLIRISQELAINGDFELGNTGFETPASGSRQYTYVADSPTLGNELSTAGLYGIGPNANTYNTSFWGHDHTTGSGNFMIIRSYVGTPQPILWQKTITVKPNTNYYFSAWAMGLNNNLITNLNPKLKFTIDGVSVGSTANLPNHLSGITAADNWTRFYGNWNSGNSTTATFAISNTNTTNFPGITTSIGLDDISISSLDPYITLVSNQVTDSQIVCVNTPIANVSIDIGSSTPPVVTGLPEGVTSVYNGYNMLISGSPSVLGTFNYTVSIGGCLPRTFSGQIVSQGSIVTQTSALSTSNQSLCNGVTITPITYSAIGSFSSIITTGLPTGLTADYNAGTMTISGTPNQSGVFNYIVTASGGTCSGIKNGTLTVNAIPNLVITPTSNVLSCANQTITLAASGASTYLWGGGLGTNASVSITTAGVYSVVGTSAFGCTKNDSITITNTIASNTITWMGISTDWVNSSNWCGGTPANNKDILIPSGLTNYPIVNNNIFINSITIQLGASLTINTNGNFVVAGNFINNGTLTNNGKIELNGITDQTFPGPGVIAVMDTLIINNASSVLLNKSISINKELRPTKGILSLGNFDVTIKSIASTTASIAATGNNGGFSYGTGRFIIERYIPTGTGIGQHGKSWQFLTAPVKGTQTIKQAWQENAAFPNQNSNAGFGTQITGSGSNAVSLGFDATTYSTSMKTYNATNNNFIAVPNTNSYPIENSLGYMIYIKGNRNDTASNQNAEPTTLRARGTVYTKGADAPPVSNIGGGQFQSIGNPFVSAIDFANTTGVVFDRGTTIDNLFYVWDPRNSGLNGYGGYQTLSATNNWRPVPGGTTNYPSGVSNSKIQSGQAFFMHATGAGGTITINESAKVSANANVYRTSNTSSNNINDKQFFETRLLDNNNTQQKLLDANVAVMSGEYSNEYNADDALKMSNSWETISLLSNGNLLSVEAKSLLNETDTLFYNAANLKTSNYRLQFIPENIQSSNLTPKLIDNYLHTESELSFTDTNNIDFSAISNTASAATNRFMVIFRAKTLLPLTFTNVSAWRKDQSKSIIFWNVENENNIHSYELERGFDQRHFEKIATLKSNQQNTGNVKYQYEDLNSNTGAIFYRVKAIDASGSQLISKIVKVNSLSDRKSFTINPNPIQNRTISIQNPSPVDGNYSFILYSTKGEKLLIKNIEIHSSNSTIEIKLPESILSGIYILKIVKDKQDVFQEKIVVQ